MDEDRSDARRLTRASRISLGGGVRFRGEAANLAAGGLATAAICLSVGVMLVGVAAIVFAAGVTGAMVERAKAPLSADQAARRDAIATLRTAAQSLPRS